MIREWMMKHRLRLLRWTSIILVAIAVVSIAAPSATALPRAPRPVLDDWGDPDDDQWLVFGEPPSLSTHQTGMPGHRIHEPAREMEKEADQRTQFHVSVWSLLRSILTSVRP